MGECVNSGSESSWLRFHYCVWPGFEKEPPYDALVDFWSIKIQRSDQHRLGKAAPFSPTQIWPWGSQLANKRYSMQLMFQTSVQFFTWDHQMVIEIA